MDTFSVLNGPEQARKILADLDRAEENRKLEAIARTRAELQERQKEIGSTTPQAESGRDAIDIEMSNLNHTEALIRAEHAQRRSVYSW